MIWIELLIVLLFILIGARMGGIGIGYAALPVITEVSKEGNVRPAKPLSISVVASQIAITASPISAAVVIFAEYLDSFDVSYLQLLAVVLFFASMLLYSQAATTVALMPAALSLGVGPEAAIASFAAVSALFVLPTYPTLIAAVEMDDTGTTQIGKYVFNHSFIIPGVVTITLSVILGFLFGGIIL